MGIHRPNIVVLVSHDTGRHIRPCGVSDVNTPNADRLACEGVVFENAFCASPLGSGSCAALFSGRPPHAVGVLGPTGAWAGFRFSSEATHAADLFKAIGYETMLLGEALESAGPGSPDAKDGGFGFDARGPAGRPLLAKDLQTEMPAILDARQDSRKPFYLQIAMRETRATRPDEAGTGPESGVTAPETGEPVADLASAAHRLDEGLGHVLNLLDQRGLTDDTVLVFTSDRGAPTDRDRMTLYDPDIGVLLIMRYPGRFAPSLRSQALVSHVDVLPTLLETAGAPSEAFDGRSILPLLTGQRGAERECVFAELTFHTAFEPKRCVRTKRCKYIFNFAGTGSYFDELYDLENDPGETRNLSRSFSDLYDAMGRPFGTKDLTGYPGDLSAECLHGGAEDPEMEAMRHELAATLAQWMSETGDPILEGPVASPRFYAKLAWLKEQKDRGLHA